MSKSNENANPNVVVAGGDDFFRFNILRDPSVSGDFGPGDDVVEISGASSLRQVRLTFTSSEVGNGRAMDSNTMANQDGGLAVRVQAEDGTGALTGPVSRFDDEGINFHSYGNFTFDVRDLVSGVARGDRFDTVILGTNGNDVFNESYSNDSYYINAGMGDDKVYGGNRNDFLVGGAGNDRLTDRQGNDSFIGGAGNDTIFGGVGDDLAIFNFATDGADMVDLGGGADTVNVTTPLAAQQVRITFTSAEVGNRTARDSGALANQDGGLAVRLQAEDGSGNLTGLVSRYDDEGIRFVSVTAGVTFDVRDLVSGVARGDQFSVVELGTSAGNRLIETGETRAYYINAGMGDDTVKGGLAADFLVGGLGNDRLNGNEGNDSMIGGAGNDTFIFTANPGNDTIVDFLSGTDKINLRAFDIGFGDVQRIASGANTLLDVDVDGDTVADFRITLLNVGSPMQSDFLF